jgi:hypothetical protein
MTVTTFLESHAMSQTDLSEVFELVKGKTKGHKKAST